MAAAVLPLLLLGAALSAPGPPEPRRAEPLAFEQVTVVDTRAGTLLTEQTVLVEEGRVQSVTPAEEITVPEHYRRIDARGRFLIPGLIDMHAHWATPVAPQLTMPLFLANGVTAIRELGGDPSFATKDRWRTEVDAGRLLGPRTLGITAAFVNQLPADGAVETADTLARRAAEQGGFIKVYNR
ncbi:MAG: hypothetical protein AAFY88_28070, partial [Acidobacteriota bacterium]